MPIDLAVSATLVRAEVEVELREDRVVGVQRRLDEVHAPEVVVAVRLDLPGPVLGER